MFVFDSGIVENTLRIEEDGVNTAKLLSELQDETGNQWPAKFFERKKVFKRDGFVRFGLARLLFDLVDLDRDLSSVSESMKGFSGRLLVPIVDEESTRRLREEEKETDDTDGARDDGQSEQYVPAVPGA